MKQFILSVVLLLITVSNSYSQRPKNDGMVPALALQENKIVYTAIIPAGSNIEKETLFGNAEEWYKKNFETADNTLTTNNIDDGLLSGTGIIHLKKHDQKANPGDVFFTIHIYTGKATYEYKVDSIYGFDNTGKFYYSDMYNEELYPTDKPKWPEPYRHSMLNSMNDKITAMVAGLQKEIINPEK